MKMDNGWNTETEDETEIHPVFEIEEIQSKQKDQLIYRASIKTEKEALQWLKTYQEDTQTQWKVDRTYPNPLRYEYRHKWVCQLASKRMTEQSQRDKKCPGTLEILIKKITTDTKKKDHYIGKFDPPLPAIITITTAHSHYLDRGHNSRYLRGDKELRRTFCNYFKDGYSPSLAMKIQYDKVKEMEDGAKKIADCHFNPLSSTVYWWHRQWKKDQFGDPLEPLDMLETKVKGYEERGSRIAIKKTSPWVVVLSTPIMIRAQKLSSAGEIVFVDTTSSCDSTHSNITLLLTATKIGAIPLTVLIHETQTKECYTDAFKLADKTFPNCFGGKKSPEVFMTDNATPEKDALDEVWGMAVQLLCHFHVGQQEWRWLLEKKNGVESAEKKSLKKGREYIWNYTLSLNLFQIMYARSAEELEESLEEFRSLPHEGYKKRVDEFLKRKEEWVKLFRDHFLIRGHHTNNYAEATMRILKDIILQRLKAYNVVALVDYFVNVWDVYLEARITKVSHMLDTTPHLLYEKLLHKMKPEFAEKIQRIDEDTFIVPSAETEEPTYEVNTSLGICLCKAGTSGAFCKHQALVHSTYGGNFPNAPPISSYDRYQLGLLAFGDKCPEPTFFLDMQEDPAVVDTWGLESESTSTNQMEISNEHGANEINHAPVPIPARKNQNQDDLSQEDKIEIVENFMEEWKRLHKMAQDEQSYFKYLKTSTQNLRKLRSSTSASGALLRLNAALRQHVGRRGKIKVQSTSIQRRPEGAPRGSSRLPAGRPTKKKVPQTTQPETSTRGCGRTSVGRPIKGSAKRPRRRRILAESIKNNVAHVRKH